LKAVSDTQLRMTIHKDVTTSDITHAAIILNDYFDG
jgi:hypothetical protein